MSISTLSSTLSYSQSQFGSLSNNGVIRMTSQTSVTQTQVTLDSSANRQNALEKLNQILTSAYEKLATGSSNPISQYQVNEALTPQKVANNILGFIERRLQQDQAEGATPEQLQSRLDAGLAGFKKGFAEAEEQLKALSLLSPEIQQDLDSTNQLVLSGIENLQTKLDKGEPLVTPTNSSVPTSLQMNKIPVGVALAAQLTQAYKFSETHYGKAEARSFQFEVTTLEGDTITIEASSSYGGSVARDGNSLVGSYSESSNFSLVVKGDLNADEMTSINNLLNKVNDLAEDFYAGTLDFNLMDLQDLAFGDDQISEFSVALAQSSIEVVTVPASTTPASDASPFRLTHGPEQAFIDKLLSALDDATLFRNPEKLILDIAQSVQLSLIQKLEPAETVEHPKNFDDFLARLMAANTERQEQENTSV